uniref:Biotin-requiring enzyme domain-containing protein n=1 Tax=Neospora caninum (strain Liverpool) TaxID=572307 RepID=A0A0F7UII0_NEOCL|nr:TPA: biotin-requiring enzyme domain-containing protein [Neospora caninum Liverpool]
MPPLSFFVCLRVPSAPFLYRRAPRFLPVRKRLPWKIGEKLASAIQQTREDYRRLVGYPMGITTAPTARVRANQVATAVGVGSSRGFSSVEFFPEGYGEEQGLTSFCREPAVPQCARSASTGADDCIEETLHFVAHAFLENSPSAKISTTVPEKHEQTSHPSGSSKVPHARGTCSVRVHAFLFAMDKPVLSGPQNDKRKKTYREEDDNGNPAKPTGMPSQPVTQDMTGREIFRDTVSTAQNRMAEVDSRQGIQQRNGESWKSLYTERHIQTEEGKEPNGRRQLHESEKRLLFTLAAAVMTIHEHRRTLEATAAVIGIPPALCFVYPGAASSSPLSAVSPVSAVLSKMPWADFTGFRVNLSPAPVDFRLTVAASIFNRDHRWSQAPHKIATTCQSPHMPDLQRGRASSDVSIEETDRNSDQPRSDASVVGTEEDLTRNWEQTPGVLYAGNGGRLLSDQQASAVTARVWVLEVPSSPRRLLATSTSDFDGREVEQNKRHNEPEGDTLLTNKESFETNRLENNRSPKASAWKTTRGSAYKLRICLAEDDNKKAAEKTDTPSSDAAASQAETPDSEELFQSESAIRVTGKLTENGPGKKGLNENGHEKRDAPAVDAEGRLLYDVEGKSGAFSGVAEINTEETRSLSEEDSATWREVTMAS